MCLGIGLLFIHWAGNSMHPFHMEIDIFHFCKTILYHSSIISPLQFLYFLSKTLINQILNFLNRAYFLMFAVSVFSSYFQDNAINIAILCQIFNFCYYTFNFQAQFRECSIFSNLSKVISYNFGKFCPPCFSLCFFWVFCPNDLFWSHSFMTFRMVVILGSAVWDLNRWTCVVRMGGRPSHFMGDLQMSFLPSQSVSQTRIF